MGWAGVGGSLWSRGGGCGSSPVPGRHRQALHAGLHPLLVRQQLAKLILGHLTEMR